MDALTFLKEQKRMCDACSDFRRKGCGKCPGYSGGCCIFAISYDLTEEKIAIVENTEEKIAIVEKWSKEHPAKTRMSEFMKQYPNALLHQGDGLPLISPCAMDASLKGRICERVFTCYECRKKYWLEEIE